MIDMMKTVLGNMFTRPATRAYPFEKREPFVNTRGQIELVQEQCIYCGICQKKCPTACITVNRSEKTWEIDAYACVICGICAEACPKKCLEIKADYRQPSVSKS